MSEQSALLDFKARKQKGNPQWFPGDHIIEFLMFCFRYNDSLSITRDIVQKVLDIFLTLQQHGIIVPDIDIPESASTIERLIDNMPHPPISYVFIDVLII